MKNEPTVHDYGFATHASGAEHLMEEETLTGAERAVADAIFAALCCCPSDDVCDADCRANEGYVEAMRAALDALRSLPVEERMAAMGMERSGYSGHRLGGHWNDLGRVHDKNSVHMDGCIPLYVEAPPSQQEERRSSDHSARTVGSGR